MEVEVQAREVGENGPGFFWSQANPLHEPVAWHGPSVMNRQELLRQAFDELRDGNLPKDEQRLWRMIASWTPSKGMASQRWLRASCPWPTVRADRQTEAAI
jgi:hypothetical protein